MSPSRKGVDPSCARLRDLLTAVPSDLALQAVSHASWVAARSDSYERLAFLGDSVLSLSVSTDLCSRFPDHTAGQLTKLRAQTVGGPACARVAFNLGVADRLRARTPPEGGRAIDDLLASERTMASIVEALIGACYLTHGFVGTAPAVVEAFEPELRAALHSPADFKSSLQERLARQGKRPVYTTDVHSGPAHAREFGCLVEIDGRAAGSGVGRTKKDAEQAAARAALKSLDAPRARPKSRAKPAKGESGEAKAAKVKASAKQPAVKRAKGGPATKPAKARSPIAKRATKGK